MRGAPHWWLVVASMLMATPLAAQSVGQLPGEDRTSGSVPPAPPPERRYSPPPFPKFSRAPPRSRHIRVAPKPKAAAKSKHVTVQKQTQARKAAARKDQRLTSRERKDQRWCGSLTKKQLSRNAKCRKVLGKQDAAKPVAKSSKPVLTKADRKDERRCGKLSLNQVLRDQRCRKVAERQLAAKPKASSHHPKAKPVAKRTSKSRPARKRSRR
jgi:hypothetical protein